MGGMRALEWAVSAPERVERLIVLACGPAATAEQIALCHVQVRGHPGGSGLPRRRLLRRRSGGGALAGPRRRPPDRPDLLPLAQPSSSSASVASTSSTRRPFDGGRYAIEGYLDHHAAKLAWRFDANSYLVLSRAMDHHDVGRGRGGVAAALGLVTAETTVVGFDSDRLYCLDEQAVMAELIRSARELVTLSSPSGHDAFLLEVDALRPVVTAALQ